MTTLSVKNILAKCADLPALAKSNPTMFNFQGLPFKDKVELIEYMPEITSTLGLKPKEYIKVALQLPKYKLKAAGIVISSQLIEESTDTVYSELVQKDSAHFDVERYKKCGIRSKGDIFASAPKKVISAGEPVPDDLTNRNINQLARKDIWVFVDNHITDFSKFSTCSTFWDLLLKEDFARFAPIFLSNLKTLNPVTEMRMVFHKFPSLIRMLDDKMIINSNMTAKQWAMFIRGMMKKKELKDWQMSDELKEALRFDIMAEVLSGNSKLTKVLQNAINDVLTDKEEENEQDEEHNQDVSGEHAGP